jgi:hypothetical protein
MTLEDEGILEKPDRGRPLLEPVMAKGVAKEDRLLQEDWLDLDERRVLRNLQLQRLNRARNRAAEELRCLPDEYLALNTEAHYPVTFSERLVNMAEKMRREIRSQKS